MKVLQRKVIIPAAAAAVCAVMGLSKTGTGREIIEDVHNRIELAEKQSFDKDLQSAKEYFSEDQQISMATRSYYQGKNFEKTLVEEYRNRHIDNVKNAFEQTSAEFNQTTEEILQGVSESATKIKETTDNVLADPRYWVTLTAMSAGIAALALSSPRKEDETLVQEEKHDEQTSAGK